MISFRSRVGWIMVGACALFGLGFCAGRMTDGFAIQTSLATSTRPVVGIGQRPPFSMQGDTVEFGRFWDLWNLLKKEYYQQPLTDEMLFHGAMAGLAQSTEDPYTTYFSPKNAQDFQDALSGKFEGIGAEIGIKDEQLQVVAPLPDTPASRAGLLAGDFILKINTEDTVGMSVEKAIEQIRGPKGTSVTLTIYRPRAKKEPREITITRDEIVLHSVTMKMLPDRIGYIALSGFHDDTQDGFDQAVTRILKEHPAGVIVDVRNNPGGLLDVAQFVAGEWIGDGVVAKERRQGKVFETLYGTGHKRLAGIKTVVLVNQGSASASEILAGALQDTGLATIVGTKTFGKGSVQNYQSFEDGSAVKITIAEWLTPKERTIHKTGLTPDVVVDYSSEDYDAKRDPQLDKAIELIRGERASNGTSTTK